MIAVESSDLYRLLYAAKYFCRAKDGPHGRRSAGPCPWCEGQIADHPPNEVFELLRTELKIRPLVT